MTNEDEPLHDKTNGMTQFDLSTTLHGVGGYLECTDLYQNCVSSHENANLCSSINA